jgi:hypothetical protein
MATVVRAFVINLDQCSVTARVPLLCTYGQSGLLPPRGERARRNRLRSDGSSAGRGSRLSARPQCRPAAVGYAGGFGCWCCPAGEHKAGLTRYLSLRMDLLLSVALCESDPESAERARQCPQLIFPGAYAAPGPRLESLGNPDVCPALVAWWPPHITKRTHVRRPAFAGVPVRAPHPPEMSPQTHRFSVRHKSR